MTSNTPAITDMNHTDRAHSSIVGGSSADRVIHCPGSVALCREVPGSGTSDFAEEGTALHEAMNFILETDLDSDRDVIGHKFNGYEITESLYDECIDPCIEFFDTIKDFDYFCEKRMEFKGVPGAFGTVDIIGTTPEKTVILDWKFGGGVPVTADENSQLMFYAYAALHDPQLSTYFSPDKPVELIIAQPRMGEEGFTRWECSVMDLEIFANKLIKAVEVATQGSAPISRGKHCKFCRAKPICPEYTEPAAEAMTIAPLFAGDELDSEISEYMGMVPVLEEWVSAVKKLAHQRLEDGADIKGQKLVAKRATRKWASEKGAEDLMKKFRIRVDEYKPRKLVTPAQAEKLLKRHGRELDDDLVTKNSSGTTMAPESDKRPAVVVTSKALDEIAKLLP